MTDAAPRPPSLPVSVTDLRRHLGSRQEVVRSLVAEGLALSDVAVPDGAEITLEGELESISEGVVLTGAAEVPWTGACRRCLRDTGGLARIEVREVWEVHHTEGETWPLDHDQLDLGPLLHDTALLALPLAPLCADDCQGPAPEAFPTSVADGAGGEDDLGDPADRPDGGERPKDPRWAALDDLDL